MRMGSAPARKAMGTPFIVSECGARHKLQPIPLEQSGNYTEAWLQELIHLHPEILPIAEIEPAFGTPFAAAREVSCAHGIIDNLYVTHTGDLVLVETKLWRNVEARRKVLAQALDYVAALMTMDYAGLESAVRKAGLAAPSLHALVADHPDALSEAAFFDAVSRNLKRGRMLVLAVGDGIREETEALARLVQHHMMAQFTLALVEMRTYRGPNPGEIIAVPHTLAQTVMVERGVLMFKDSMPVIEPVPPSIGHAPKTITEAVFYEEIARKDPALPGAIKAFLDQAAELGIYPDFQASLNLKVDLADAAKPLNVGYITKNGQLRTSTAGWLTGETIALRYAGRLAELIGGVVAVHDGIYVSTNGKSAPLVSRFLPQHADAWLEAIQELIHAYEAKLQQEA
jgi:hypothetical protein